MRQNKKIPYAIGWLCFGMTLFSACGQSEVEELENEDLRMSIVASIEHLGNAPQGRYVVKSLDDVNFANPDEIGIFVDGEAAVQWVYGTSGWQAETEDNIVNWPDIDNEHIFQAFYPYVAGASQTAIPMPDLTTQSGTINSLSACDFLIAENRLQYPVGGAVNLLFSHVSSLFELTIKAGGDLQGATLTGISIQGENLVAPGVYSFGNEEEPAGVKLKSTSGNQSNLITTDLNIGMGAGDVVLYFIVNANTVAYSEVTLTLLYEIDNVEYKVEASGIGDLRFTGGNKHSSMLSVVNGELSISGSSISSWGTGGSLGDIEIKDSQEVSNE